MQCVCGMFQNKDVISQYIGFSYLYKNESPIWHDGLQIETGHWNMGFHFVQDHIMLPTAIAQTSF